MNKSSTKQLFYIHGKKKKTSIQKIMTKIMTFENKI